jgi:hypothetical protein
MFARSHIRYTHNVRSLFSFSARKLAAHNRCALICSCRCAPLIGRTMCSVSCSFASLILYPVRSASRCTRASLTDLAPLDISLCIRCAHPRARYLAPLSCYALLSRIVSLRSHARLTRAGALVELRSACYFWSKAPKKYPAVGPKGPCFVEKISRCSGYFQQKGASLQKDLTEKEALKGPYF